MTVEERIKQARKKAGITQEDLGAKLEVSSSMIVQYETNKRTPKYETVRRIVAALDAEPWELMGYDGSIRGGQDRPRFMSRVPSQQESDFYRAFEGNAPPSILEKLKQNLIFDKEEEGILRYALAQWAERIRIKSMKL